MSVSVIQTVVSTQITQICSYLNSVGYPSTQLKWDICSTNVPTQTRPDMLEMKFLHSLTHGTSLPVSSCLLKPGAVI